MKITDKTLFPLDYLDWCKENKGVKKIEETERFDWICEFYYSDAWNRKPINGMDIYLAMGGNK